MPCGRLVESVRTHLGLAVTAQVPVSDGNPDSYRSEPIDRGVTKGSQTHLTGSRSALLTRATLSKHDIPEALDSCPRKGSHVRGQSIVPEIVAIGNEDNALASPSNAGEQHISCRPAR